MKEFNELVEIVSKLRTECPWDREQTHETLAKHLIEEAYELLDALAEFQIDSKNDSMLKDELGDLLLQILLHSKIAEDNTYEKSLIWLIDKASLETFDQKINRQNCELNGEKS